VSAFNLNASRIPESGISRWVTWWVIVCALLAVAPGLHPGTAWYLDNPAHLLELRALATEILPGERWFSGWTDSANAGFAVGQLNAPLPWTAVALLVMLGVPSVPLYLFVAVCSNVVLALGARRLLLRSSGSEIAALLGACLAATCVPELIGISGSLAGMWPARLATGLLLWDLSLSDDDRSPAQRGLWIAAILFSHTYVALIAVASRGLQLLGALRRGELRLACDLGVGLLLAGGVTAALWGPLLDPALRHFNGAVQALPPRQTLALLFVPLDAYTLIVWGGQLELLGGWAAVPAAVLTVVGAVLAWGRPLCDKRLCRELLVLVVLLLFVLIVLLPLTQWSVLGPNPWRHLVWGRLALVLAAGIGLTRWIRRVEVATLVGLVLALCAAFAGLQELPVGATARRNHADLRATWADIASHAPEGLVYHQDTFRLFEHRSGLEESHPGPLMGVHHPIRLLGSWYGVAPIRTIPWVLGVAGYAMSLPPSVWSEDPDALTARFRVFGVGAVVAVDETLGAALDASPDWVKVSHREPFSAFVAAQPPLPLVGVPPGAATLVEVHSERGRTTATVIAESEVPFRFRRTFHPWWEAALDGRAIPLEPGPNSGLVVGTLPHGGELALTWVDRSGPWRWLSLLSVLVMAGVSWVESRWRGQEATPRSTR
jgi:hypothetical protein